VYVGSYDPILKTYQSLGGPNMIYSQGVNQHPVPLRHLHHGASSHKDTLPRDLLISHAPAIGTSHEGWLGCTPPARLILMSRRKILLDRLNPHHTPKMHAKISPVVTTLSTPCALTTHKQSSTKHHIIDITHSKSSSK
jgi:hypothetical protein